MCAYVNTYVRAFVYVYVYISVLVCTCACFCTSLARSLDRLVSRAHFSILFLAVSERKRHVYREYKTCMNIHRCTLKDVWWERENCM